MDVRSLYVWIEKESEIAFLGLVATTISLYRTASISARVGMEFVVPYRCTDREASAVANRTASQRSLPSLSAATKPPLNASPAQQKRWNQERNYVTIASKQKQIDRIRAEMVAPDGNEQSIRFRFPEPAPTGNEVIRLSNLGKSFGEKHLFSHVDLLIRKQECVCLIGANGCGKTTLLKILCGMERQSEGDYRLGAGVRIGYYSQHTRDLHEEKTVMQEMDDAFPLIPHNTLRGYLGMFLFRGDEIEKPISALSGGEKARIRLLKLVLSGANVLLLDEPTNHLDIASAEVLEKAIEQFSGTVLIVSHDRYLIDRLADRVLLLEQEFQ